MLDREILFNKYDVNYHKKQTIKCFRMSTQIYSKRDESELKKTLYNPCPECLREEFMEV